LADAYDHPHLAGLGKIQAAVEQLSDAELRQFNAWFSELRARLWNEQIDRDLASGNLHERAKKWRADHKSGTTTDLL
jgi:hypothetical protein